MNKIDYTRLENVRVIVDNILLNINDVDERRCAYCHLYGVSVIASMLALRRNLNPELASIMGMLHDIYAYKTGMLLFHGQSGAEMVRPILRELKMFTVEEIKLIMTAIFHHSKKDSINGIYDELLKDADTLQHYLYNTGMKVHKEHALRLAKILDELSIIHNYETKDEDANVNISTENKRGILANIAEELANKRIIGEASNNDYKEICNYWPGDDVLAELNSKWCAAFVYYCCIKAGFVLPIRHPLVTFRFAGVGAWLDWSRLEEDLFHPFEEDFEPERGDIVIYDKILSDKMHDHIGIVLKSDLEYITVAEGNVDNMNYSGVVKRSRYANISRYIRIPDNYEYQYTSEFNWKIE